MQFTKMQGAGNDFILVETGDTVKDWPDISRTICDRHYGAGADGLLLLMPSETADIRMLVFNADGSEPEVCGNGLRCLIRYYLDNRRAAGTKTEIRVETANGIREVRVVETDGEREEILVNMGQPVFGGDEIPVKPGQCTVDINNMLTCNIAAAGNEYRLNLVSMGNPHAVHFTETPVAEFPLDDIGPEITGNKIFPEGANFEAAQVIDRRNIDARVRERGVGETLACGSGACATAVAAIIHDYVENRINVRLPGGILKVEWDGKGDVFLSGPAEKVFTGEWGE